MTGEGGGSRGTGPGLPQMMLGPTGGAGCRLTSRTGGGRPSPPPPPAGGGGPEPARRRGAGPPLPALPHPTPPGALSPPLYPRPHPQAPPGLQNQPHPSGSAQTSGRSKATQAVPSALNALPAWASAAKPPPLGGPPRAQGLPGAVASAPLVLVDLPQDT